MTTLYNQLLLLYDSLHVPQRNKALHNLAQQVNNLHQKTQEKGNAQEALQEILGSRNYAKLALPQQHHLKSIATRLTLAQHIVDKLWPSQQTTIEANNLFEALYHDILPKETKQYTSNPKQPVIATKKETHINFFIQTPQTKRKGMFYAPFSQPPLFSHVLQREDLRLDTLLHNINNNIQQHTTPQYTRPIIKKAYVLSTITKTIDNTKREAHYITTHHEERHFKDYMNSQGIIDFYSKEVSACIGQNKSVKPSTIQRDIQRTKKCFNTAKNEPAYKNTLDRLQSQENQAQQLFARFPLTTISALIHRYPANYVSSLLSVTPHQYIADLQDML